jgi:hypothetical protein
VSPLLFADVNVSIGVVIVIVGIIGLVLSLLALIAFEVAGEHRQNVRAHRHV